MSARAVKEEVLIAVATDLHASNINDESNQMQEQLVDVKKEYKIATANEENLLSLNDDCLIKIFESLEFIDWIYLSLVNERFHHIIKYNIISRYFLNFGEISTEVSIRKVFKLFKNQIVKMGITQYDIQYKGNANTNSDAVLEIMKQYCSVDKLKALFLNVQLDKVRSELLEEFASLLRNIQVFTITGYASNINNINILLSQTDDLKELHLIGVNLKPLNNVVGFTNLEQLIVQQSTITDVETLNKILASNSKLKTLKYLNNFWMNHTSNKPQSVEFLQFSPNLEEFALDFCIYYSEIIESYSSILNLNKLKTLRIVSTQFDYLQIFRFLETLARKNTVKNLIIEMKYRFQNPVFYMPLYDSISFKYFQSLETFEIINPVHSSETFLISFTQALPNLKKCVLRTEKKCSQSLIINLVRNIKKLTQLTLYAQQFNVTKTFYSKLWHAKSLTDDVFYLELRVSEEQKRKFFDLKSVYNENVVKIASY